MSCGSTSQKKRRIALHFLPNFPPTFQVISNHVSISPCLSPPISRSPLPLSLSPSLPLSLSCNKGLVFNHTEVSQTRTPVLCVSTRRPQNASVILSPTRDTNTSTPHPNPPASPPPSDDKTTRSLDATVAIIGIHMLCPSVSVFYHWRSV